METLHPNRDGECGFDHLTSTLVSSKAYREGCRASRGGIPYWGDLRAKGEGTSSRVEPTVDPHTEENPGNEDEEQDEGIQQHNMDNYIRVRDRAKRRTVIPVRYRDGEDTHEPITFQEVINSSEKDEWVRAMEEEMSSLKKNHTWELVDQPTGQKL
ncbi:retrovirus-related pol polyprotein from transposon TNT 1-94 [Tanacetum coccineum]